MEENETLAINVNQDLEKEESDKDENKEPRRPLTRWEVKEMLKKMKKEEKRRKKAKLRMPTLLFPRKHKK